MKKTLLAMLLLGGTVSMFGQTTPTTSPTTTPTTTPTSTTPTSTSPTSTQPTSTTPTSTQPTSTSPMSTQPTSTSPMSTQPTTTTPATNGTMNNTNSTTNGTWNNGNTTNGTLNNTTNGTYNNGTPSTGVSGTNPSGTWNGVSASTSWTPETAPTYGWNSYGNWPNSGSLYPTVTAGGFPIPAATDASGSMNSASANSAYGTAVSALPANVQSRFTQDFPSGATNSYTWNQYGDWFHTYYANNGRLWQYYYSSRGDGYALALPVIQTYVPENIIASALQKYGSSLYSIAMVKTNSGNSAYQIGLLQHGQLATTYLDDNGASVADVWRTEELNSTQSNAAMDNGSTNSSTMDNSSQSTSTDASATNQTTDQTGDQTGADTNSGKTGKDKSKLKIKHEDGSIDKIKTKNGQTKVKSKPAPSTSDMSNQQ